MLIAALLLLVGVSGQFSNSSVPVFSARVGWSTASIVCNLVGGYLSMPYTRAYHEVITQSAIQSPGSTAPQLTTWVGGRNTGNTQWSWVQGPFSTAPVVFSNGPICVYSDICAWAPGFPTGPGLCVDITAALWQNNDCSTPLSFACEIPYTTRYQCGIERVSRQAGEAICLSLGGWLATTPGFAPMAILQATPSCQQIPAVGSTVTLMGGDSLAGPIGDFRWTQGYLGRESNGLGRLFSRGLRSQGPPLRFGFPGPDWDPIQPDNFFGEEYCLDVNVANGLLNDIGCEKIGPSPTSTSYSCEIPASPTPAPVLPATSCSFDNPLIVQDDNTVFAACEIQVPTLITSSFTGRQLSVNGTVILITGRSTAMTVTIADSQLIETSVGIDGVFASGSTIVIERTRIVLTALVPGFHPPGTLVFLLIFSATLTSTTISLRGNLMQVNAPPTTAASLITSVGQVTIAGGTLECTDSQITVTSPTNAVAFDSRVGTAIQSSGIYAVTSNTATVRGTSSAVLLRETSLSLTGGSLVISLNSITLTGGTTVFVQVLGGTFSSGTVETAFNVVNFMGAPTVIALQLPMGPQAMTNVLQNNFTGTSTNTLISGLSGSGTLQLQCTYFFGVFLLTTSDYEGKIPQLGSTTVNPCQIVTTRPASPPTTFFFGPAAIASSDSRSVLSGGALYGVIIAAAVLILIVFIIIIIIVVRRRRKARAHPQHRQRSHSRSSKSGSKRGSRSSRRSGRSSSRHSKSGASATDGTGAGSSSYASGSYTGYEGSYTGYDGSSYSGHDGSSYASGSYTGHDGSSYSGHDGSTAPMTYGEPGKRLIVDGVESSYAGSTHTGGTSHGGYGSSSFASGSYTGHDGSSYSSAAPTHGM